jgi:hypothetical protein
VFTPKYQWNKTAEMKSLIHLGEGELKNSHVVLYDIAKFLDDGKSTCIYNYHEKTKSKVTSKCMLHGQLILLSLI